MTYLDNAATSFPKAPGVGAAVAACIESLPGSTGRASHPLAIESSRLLFHLRSELARFLGIRAPERLVFSKNATEALNIAILGSLPRGGRALCSSIEHNAVMRPLRRLESERGLALDRFGVDAQGLIDEVALEAGIDKKPDLLVVTAASNVSGAPLPVSHIVSLAHRREVPVLVDGSQLVGHRIVDLEAMGVDYFAFPGHKGLLGPAGTGGLYIAEGRELEPLISGGTGSASSEETQPRFLPDALEAGTPNLASLAGLGAALAYIEAEGLANIARRVDGLTRLLAEGLAEIEGITVLGGAVTERVPVVSVTCEKMPEREIAMELDLRGIATRVGLHCSPAAHRSFGSFERGGSLRFSPGPFTLEEDLDLVLAAMKEILR